MTDASDLLSTPLVPPPDGPAGRAWSRPDRRRTLQLALASLWLLDGVLQMQAFFFTKAFGTQMVTMTAEGNPPLIARSILWSGRTIGHHPVVVNALFALVQVALGLGMAWRPTLRVALAASVAWSLGVWWVGEGFGGVFAGTADPLSGAPGAVILYGLLAVVLWPTDRPGRRPSFVAARAVGATTARTLWLVLWGSLAYLVVAGANRSAGGLHQLLVGEEHGEPGWLVWVDRQAGSLVDHRGLLVSVSIALLLSLVAIGVFLPPAAANATLVLAMAVGLTFWVVGQNFGALFTSSATDVNSGPLLVLLALAYWNHPAGPDQLPVDSSPSAMVVA